MNVGNSLTALKIQNNMESQDSKIVSQIEKLSSGMRVNQASDDASGLKISEKMRKQIKGLDMSIDNATEGISMLQTAEGGLEKIADLLQRMNELSIKAVNGVHTYEDKEKISIEYEQLKEEIDRIAETTIFNGKHLLNITTGETKIIQGMRKIGTAINCARATDTIDFSTIGDGNEFIVTKGDEEYRFTFAYGKNRHVSDGSILISLTGKETNEEKAEKLALAVDNAIADVSADVHLSYPENGKNYIIAVTSNDPEEGLKIDLRMETNAPIIKVGNGESDHIYLNLKSSTTSNLEIDVTDILTTQNALEATKKIHKAIEEVSERRSTIGVIQGRLENTIKRINIEKENTEASESRIRDLDMAKELVNSAKSKIIQQSSISMLAQANQTSGNVLTLIAENDY